MACGRDGKKAGASKRKGGGGWGRRGNWEKLIGFLTCQRNPGPALRGEVARGIFSAICYKIGFTF